MRKRSTFLLPLISIVAVMAILISTLSSEKTDVNLFPIIIPAVQIFIGFSYYRSFKKQKRLLMSYTVTLSDNEIIREQLNTPPLTINFMEIKEIVKSEKGNFTIKGVSRQDVIYIPYLIDDPIELEKCLATFGPITVHTKDPFYRKYRIWLSIAVLGLIVSIYTVNNKIIVGICGTLVSGLMAWGFYERITSKNLPQNIKRRSWILLLVIASIIYTVYIKLTE